MDKKAVIGGGIVWIPGTILIVFILIFFIIFMATLWGDRFVSDDAKVKVERGGKDLVLLESFFSFLNEKDENILIKDLIKGEIDGNGEKFSKFRERAFNFLKEEGIDGWIRIYGFDEEISRYSSGRYKQYGSSFDFFISPDRPTAVKQEENVCNPDKNSLFYVINENKKIVMCAK